MWPKPLSVQVYAYIRHRPPNPVSQSCKCGVGNCAHPYDSASTGADHVDPAQGQCDRIGPNSLERLIDFSDNLFRLRVEKGQRQMQSLGGNQPTGRQALLQPLKCILNRFRHAKGNKGPDTIPPFQFAPHPSLCISRSLLEVRSNSKVPSPSMKSRSGTSAALRISRTLAS